MNQIRNHFEITTLVKKFLTFNGTLRIISLFKEPYSDNQINKLHGAESLRD
jgi:hypothetical protein